MERTTLSKPILLDQDAHDEGSGRFVPAGYFHAACAVALFSTLVAAGSLIAQVTAHDPLRALEQRLADGAQMAVSDVRLMAEAGSAEARFRVAERYRAGNGMDVDIVEVHALYLAAAEAGHPEAQHEVAEMYAYGYGVKQDFAKASEWAARATENGYGKSIKETTPR